MTYKSARTRVALLAFLASVTGLTACADPGEHSGDASGVPPTGTPTPAPSVTGGLGPSPTPTAHTVLMHDGVIRAELPETFAGPDEFGVWTDGTATIGCWAWRDATIPVDGVTAAQINATWIAQWNDWGYYSAGEVWPYSNINGYDDSDIWSIVMIYYSDGGDYDFEVWEPHAYLVDDDVFIECTARSFSPTEAPPVDWDAAFLPMVESITIVDRDAILTNYWGTERGDY